MAPVPSIYWALILLQFDTPPWGTPGIVPPAFTRGVPYPWGCLAFYSRWSPPRAFHFLPRFSFVFVTRESCFLGSLSFPIIRLSFAFPPNPVLFSGSTTILLFALSHGNSAWRHILRRLAFFQTQRVSASTLRVSLPWLAPEQEFSGSSQFRIFPLQEFSWVVFSLQFTAARTGQWPSPLSPSLSQAFSDPPLLGFRFLKSDINEFYSFSVASLVDSRLPSL